MSLYVITAVHLDDRGEVERVKWASVDSSVPKFYQSPYEVPVDRVVQAIDHGDIVEIVFPTSHGLVSGGKVKRKVLPSGYESIQAENDTPGRRLEDLPTF